MKYSTHHQSATKKFFNSIVKPAAEFGMAAVLILAGGVVHANAQESTAPPKVKNSSSPKLNVEALFEEFNSLSMEQKSEAAKKLIARTTANLDYLPAISRLKVREKAITKDLDAINEAISIVEDDNSALRSDYAQQQRVLQSSSTPSAKNELLQVTSFFVRKLKDNHARLDEMKASKNIIEERLIGVRSKLSQFVRAHELASRVSRDPSSESLWADPVGKLNDDPYPLLEPSIWAEDAGFFGSEDPLERPEFSTIEAATAEMNRLLRK